MQNLSYIITGVSIVATVANAYKKRWCFIVWLFTNAFWIIYDLCIGAYGQALLYVANFIICVMGLRNWKKEKTSCTDCREKIRTEILKEFVQRHERQTKEVKAAIEKEFGEGGIDKPKGNRVVEKTVIDKKTGKKEKYTYYSVRHSFER